MSSYVGHANIGTTGRLTPLVHFIENCYSQHTCHYFNHIITFDLIFIGAPHHHTL